MQQFFLFDRYLNTYKKYQDLLNNKAETEINAFIQDEPVLLALSKVLFFFYPECCTDILKCEDIGLLFRYSQPLYLAKCQCLLQQGVSKFLTQLLSDNNYLWQYAQYCIAVCQFHLTFSFCLAQAFHIDLAFCILFWPNQKIQGGPWPSPGFVYTHGSSKVSTNGIFRPSHHVANILDQYSYTRAIAVGD